MVKTMPRLFGRRRKSEIEAGPNWSWKINRALLILIATSTTRLKPQPGTTKIAKLCQKITKPGKMQYFLATVSSVFQIAMRT